MYFSKSLCKGRKKIAAEQFPACIVVVSKRKEVDDMERKGWLVIGVVAAIVLLLFWLFVAEDLSAWWYGFA